MGYTWFKEIIIMNKKMIFFLNSLIFSSLFHQFSFKLHGMMPWNNLTSSRRKTHKKHWGPNLGKTGQILVQSQVFCCFSSLVHQFPFKLHRMIAWNSFELLVEIKLAGKKLAHVWAKLAKIGRKNRFCVIFSSLVHLFWWKLHRMIAWNNV